MSGDGTACRDGWDLKKWGAVCCKTLDVRSSMRKLKCFIIVCMKDNRSEEMVPMGNSIPSISSSWSCSLFVMGGRWFGMLPNDVLIDVRDDHALFWERGRVSCQLSISHSLYYNKKKAGLSLRYEGEVEE